MTIGFDPILEYIKAENFLYIVEEDETPRRQQSKPRSTQGTQVSSQQGINRITDTKRYHCTSLPHIISYTPHPIRSNKFTAHCSTCGWRADLKDSGRAERVYRPVLTRDKYLVEIEEVLGRFHCFDDFGKAGLVCVEHWRAFEDLEELRAHVRGAHGVGGFD